MTAGELGLAYAKEFDHHSADQLGLILDFVRRGHRLGEAQLARGQSIAAARRGGAAPGA